MLMRVARDTALVCLAMAAVAAWWWPGNWRLALGVVGGGVLIELAFWAIRRGVEGWLRGGTQPAGSAGLVKFFTRHVMLALAAYGMMVRLHLDPVGMLAGVSALGVAVAFEGARLGVWRRLL